MKKQYTHYYSGKPIDFYGETTNELVDNVISFLKTRGENVDEDILRKSVESRAKDKFANPPKSGKKQIERPAEITAEKAIGATLALIKNHSGGSVDQATFNQRVQICKSCPLYQQTSDCMGCGSLGKVNSLLSSLKTKFGWSSIEVSGEGGKFCGFCGCSISLLAATKKSNYNITAKDLNRPAFCWLNKNSAAYKSDKS